MNGWQVCLMMSVVLICMVMFIAVLVRREQEQELADAWLELARRNGLTYKPGGTSLAWILFLVKPPSASGEYRGRHVSLSRVAVSVGGPDGGAAPATQLSLQVKNLAQFSLAIRKKGILDRAFGKGGGSSGNEDFDRHFKVEGQPRDFVQKATELIIPITPHKLAWALEGRPCIELSRSNMICWQNPALTDVHTQTTVLNLLCDLAELAEKMGTVKGPTNIAYGEIPCPYCGASIPEDALDCVYCRREVYDALHRR